MSDTIAIQSLSLSAARRVLDAALAHAEANGWNMCVTVADPSGEAIISARMDMAPRLSAEIARNKAFTVASFGGMPTHLWWPAIQNEPSLVHGITHTPRLIVFGGGVPVLVAGVLAGAVGVSGGSAEQDRECAEAGAAAVA
jgi:glc operon protein GlcG